MAFPKSFGNVINAKKAIEARGWNPLNYYLLTVVPGDNADVVDLTSHEHDKENVPQCHPFQKSMLPKALAITTLT
jgi:hypothetical protein